MSGREDEAAWFVGNELDRDEMIRMGMLDWVLVSDRLPDQEDEVTSLFQALILSRIDGGGWHGSLEVCRRHEGAWMIHNPGDRWCGLDEGSHVAAWKINGAFADTALVDRFAPPD